MELWWGGTFRRKPHSRLHECFRWSSLLVRGSRSAARCRGSSGHGAALLAAVASGFQPGQNLLATPRPSRGVPAGPHVPATVAPVGQRGRGLQHHVPTALTSREALMAKLEGSRSGHQTKTLVVPPGPRLVENEVVKLGMSPLGVRAGAEAALLFS